MYIKKKKLFHQGILCLPIEYLENFVPVTLHVLQGEAMDKVPKREWYAFSKFFNEILKSDTNYVLIIIIFFTLKSVPLSMKKIKF